MNIWRLPCDRTVLQNLTLGETIAALWVRWSFIRYHRDQVGDDRCFLDDWLVWQFLSDTPLRPHFSGEEGMVECKLFWTHRRADGIDTLPVGAIVDPEHWDDILWTDSKFQLKNALFKLQCAIRTHRDITNRPRTADDDRVLYAHLPEKLSANFCLPSEAQFLGEERAPVAGCPSFWRSHETCASARCNLHCWGPCQ